MTDPKPSNGKTRMARLALEGLVIVLSILLAFWIDAMWDLSRDRAQAREFLDAVQSELAANVGILRDHVQSCEGGAYAAQRQLVSMTGPVPPRISEDSLTTLMALSLRGIPPRLETPAFDALVSAGALSDMNSAELRSEFGRWRTLLESRESRRAIAEDRVIKTLDYLERVGAAARLHEGSRVGLPPSNFTVDVEALLSDPVFAGTMGSLAVRKGQMCLDDDARRIQGEEFLRIVEAELAR
jgi:hypothetical protein